MLNPAKPEEILRYEEEEARNLRDQKDKEEHRKRVRDEWIADLRANPDRICHPPNIKPGEYTNDQHWLMFELKDRSSATGRSEYANWQALIPVFGEAVANAYREAAVNHWRNYMPNLRSEGAPADSSPYTLVFAMAGLEMEANEHPEFPGNLDDDMIRHALRYITWELNGFPNWLERVYQVFPEVVKEVVVKELLWELDNTDSNESMHHILSDLVYYAPWLHKPMSLVIMDWVEKNPTRLYSNRNYCLHILVSGGIDTSRLANFASLQITQTNDPDSIAWWYALRVDCEPENGIIEVEKWLASLDKTVAIRVSQIFITTLMGDKYMRDGAPYLGRFREVKHLKSLYVLMHRYIRAKDDIDRTGCGAYSPVLRDEAQSARNKLFNLIAEVPGKDSYTVIKQLVREHPDPDYRPWMSKMAYRRAEEDGDLEPWSDEQIGELGKSQTLTPVTHRQLFDLTVHRLFDLKNWLERGNDSPWQTWKRAEEETEMRNLIAGWLNQNSRGQYTTAQEPELANSQRVDIWLHTPSGHSPVPIELKLLDKGWSGPKLCERLRNQLAGDYSREAKAGCGVLLLVWQGQSSKKSWTINNYKVGVDELSNALKIYWQGIADRFPGVEVIEVVVIDLTQRSRVSDT